MTCFECAKDIAAYPCACGYKPKELKVAEQWLVRRCGAQGCSVQVREKLADHEAVPICKWHKGGQAYNSTAIASRADGGPLIDKEEFGVDLFEAIRLQSAMRQAERTADLFKRKGLKQRERESLDNAKALSQQLQLILKRDTIAPADLKRLLAIT